ncbi:MAG: fumarylacetoacetase [Gemmataceae bacterium]|nr:fumarylacetoacetase [Gemmata sp.]MDW8196041.1 fumarylacetoacetase [Gemmataceae bacterium]
MIDETHDPARRSWVESANRPGCDFPIQNLPLGVFTPPGSATARIGVAIGEAILDVSDWLPGDQLNAYMALSSADRADFRRHCVRRLEAGAKPCALYSQTECRLHRPVTIGDYTDFYASIDHATNVGKLFRPENPLLPNYKHVPIAYHGRASSIVVSGTPVKRPQGQLGEGRFGPTQELDYEVEVGFFVGPGNALGEPIAIAKARSHIAGVCLVNDWSARDIQRWEYQPLGPFLAKNFATSISPWVVTAEALAPFWTEPPPHDVPILPYLREPVPGALDLTVEVWFRTAAMTEPIRLSHAAFKDMYWTAGQMIAHHTVNGCPLQPGDLIASGTVSGPQPDNRGCLLELTAKGAEPLRLPTGETRTFLHDGDEVILTGYCERPGWVRIGLGHCRGTIRPQ